MYREHSFLPFKRTSEKERSNTRDSSAPADAVSRIGAWCNSVRTELSASSAVTSLGEGWVGCKRRRSASDEGALKAWDAAEVRTRRRRRRSAPICDPCRRQQQWRRTGGRPPRT